MDKKRKMYHLILGSLLCCFIISSPIQVKVLHPSGETFGCFELDSTENLHNGTKHRVHAQLASDGAQVSYRQISIIAGEDGHEFDPRKGEVFICWLVINDIAITHLDDYKTVEIAYHEKNKLKITTTQDNRASIKALLDSAERGIKHVIEGILAMNTETVEMNIEDDSWSAKARLVSFKGTEQTLDEFAIYLTELLTRLKEPEQANAIYREPSGIKDIDSLFEDFMKKNPGTTLSIDMKRVGFPALRIDDINALFYRRLTGEKGEFRGGYAACPKYPNLIHE